MPVCPAYIKWTSHFGRMKNVMVAAYALKSALSEILKCLKKGLVGLENANNAWAAFSGARRKPFNSGKILPEEKDTGILVTL